MLLLAVTAFSQEIEVTKFGQATQFIAADDQIRDWDNEICALVKIQGAKIDSVSGAFEVRRNGAEVWAYMTNGDRKLTIARELTKVHEQIIRTTTKEAAEKYADGTLKGEIVLVLEGKKTEEKSEITLSDAVAYAQKLIDGGMRPTEAAKQAAAMAGLKKNDIYKELM